jgi:hypothetical protein
VEEDVKLIRKPAASEWREQVCCWTCKAVLEVELSDLTLYLQRADRPNEGDTWLGRYRCPECKAHGTVAVPSNFQHLVRKE